MYFGTPVVSIGVAIARRVTDRRSTASMRRARLPHVWRSASLLGGRWISGRARFALSRRAVNGARSTSRRRQSNTLQRITSRRMFLSTYFTFGTTQSLPDDTETAGRERDYGRLPASAV